MKYVYILFICLILFYILSRFFEKYYSQENFDPSLVPVSSIITLAKVAQKIVDGNGTLTNPANLNIGTPNNKGNLLVTGNSTTNGNKQIDGTLGVNGATTLSNTLDVTGATTLSNTLGVTGNSTIVGTFGVTGATTIAGTLGVTNATTIGAITTPAATTSLTVNGATKINGDTTVNGATAIIGNTTVGGTLSVAGNLKASEVIANWDIVINARSNPTNTNAYQIYNYDGGRLNVWSNEKNTDILTITPTGNLTVSGLSTSNATISNNLTINNVKIEKYKGQYDNPAAYTQGVYDNPSGTYPYYIKIIVMNKNGNRWNHLEAMTYDSTSTPWVFLGAYNSGDPAIKYNVNNANPGLWTLSSGSGDNTGPYYWYVTVER